MSTLLSTLKASAWWVPIAIAGTDLVATVIRVEGESMQPTLNPEGATLSDWVLVEKISYKWLHRYTRGDVAILWAPDQNLQIVKRVVALEHDVVVGDGAKNTSVPQGRCWIEGDNQSSSGDSRTLYGPVHLGLLEGRVTHVVWPPWRISAVPRRAASSRVIAAPEPPGPASGSEWS